MLVDAEQQFVESLVGRSLRTTTTYRTALGRFHEFLEADGVELAAVTTGGFASDVLEQFYPWLVRVYGRDDRFTVVTYVAGVRAFFRFLRPPPDLPPRTLQFEELRDNLREVMGRSDHRTPRDRPPIAADRDARRWARDPPGGRARRRRLGWSCCATALIRTLFATGMRREEVASLNRADVQDGHVRQALVTGKGDKERVVFFDEPSLAAIRAYLEARADRLSRLFLRHDLARGRARTGGHRYRLSPKGVWGVVKRYAAAVGVRRHHPRLPPRQGQRHAQSRRQALRGPGHPRPRLARDDQEDLRPLRDLPPARCLRPLQRDRRGAGRGAGEPTTALMDDGPRLEGLSLPRRSTVSVTVIHARLPRR